MKKLLYMLEIAIFEERYEDANEIRKKIEELEKLYTSFFENKEE